MKKGQRQKGFTLIEIMVVVVIIATLSGFSFFAINQATDRRYLTQAEDLLAWLEQISDFALLEGTTYGVYPNGDILEAVVFYNYRWYRVKTPEPFYFKDSAVISLPTAQANSSSNSSRESIPEASGNALLPNIVMHADGYMEPASDIVLTFEEFSPVFKYRWEDEGLTLVMERGL